MNHLLLEEGCGLGPLKENLLLELENEDRELEVWDDLEDRDEPEDRDDERDELDDLEEWELELCLVGGMLNHLFL